MTINRAQVTDLQPGDVVEVVENVDGDDITTRGPLRAEMGERGLRLGAYGFRLPSGEPATWFHTLTVVSRAPRPLYVNHPRTEPVPGDVVRDADSSNDRHVWVKNVDGFSNEWLAVPGHVYVPRSQLPERLRLLVDGETGQVVQ